MCVECVPQIAQAQCTGATNNLGKYMYDIFFFKSGISVKKLDSFILFVCLI